MSIHLMSAVFSYVFPKRVEYVRMVIPFKRDPDTWKPIETGNQMVERRTATTGSSMKFVLLALADHANDDGKGAYPSTHTLTIKTNLETPTVIGALLALRYHTFINFVGASPRDTNNYDIDPERLVKPFDQGGKLALPPQVNLLYRGGKADLSDSSFNHPNPPPNKENTPQPENPYIHILEGCARTHWGADFLGWRKVCRDLERCQWAKDGEIITITGLGMKAALFEERYGKIFASDLLGGLNEPVRLVFCE